MNTDTLSDRELLIRIDERQQTIMTDISQMRKDIREKVPDDRDYQDLKDKVDVLWEMRIKILAYASIIAAVAVFLANWLNSLIIQ